MKFFNTAGPVDPVDHYLLNPLERLDLEDLMFLIAQKKYFSLHAPRQTGKTSLLMALMHKINLEGNYHCLYVNIETAQTAREDVGEGMQSIVTQLAVHADHFLNDHFFKENRDEIELNSGPHSLLVNILSAWARSVPKPIVLLID